MRGMSNVAKKLTNLQGEGVELEFLEEERMMLPLFVRSGSA